MKIARFLFYAATFLGVSVISHALNRQALARDFGQYADVPQEIRDWYANAELTDAAKQRLHWKKCCDHADAVKTRFRVNKSNGDDEWYWLREGQRKRIPLTSSIGALALLEGSPCSSSTAMSNLLLPRKGRYLMVNGNTYLINGAPQHGASATRPSPSKTSTSSAGGERPAVLLLPRARRFRPGESPYGRRGRWGKAS